MINLREHMDAFIGVGADEIKIVGRSLVGGVPNAGARGTEVREKRWGETPHTLSRTLL